MILNIKDYVKTQKEKLAKKVSKLERPPHLLIIQIGNNAASNSYIKGKLNDALEIGIAADLYKFARPNEAIRCLVGNRMACRYDGIILQEPSGLSEKDRKDVLECISREQDVDGFRMDSKHLPCTPKGIMDILDNFYGDIAGANIVVVGRGELVGKPLVPMLIDKQATVTSCNSKTENLQGIMEGADVIITAAGCRNLLAELPDNGHEYFVIDAGINFDENGKLCGDCSKDLYDQKNVTITPVPGGVGLTTRLALMQNTLAIALENIEEERDCRACGI